MIQRLRARAALGFMLLLLAWPAWAQVAMAELSRQVTDLTGTLSDSQVTALERTLTVFESQKGSQIAVLIVPTTTPEAIEQFGIRVAEQWKIGRAGADDGLILIVAKDDRKMRIEVGYGLEGAIPDAVARRVIDEIIAPRFKAGQYYEGIEAGVQQLMRLIEGEALPAPGSTGADMDGDAFMILIVAGVVGGLLLTTLMSQVAAASVAALGSAIVGAMWLGFSLVLLIIALFVFGGVVMVLGGGQGWSSGGGMGGGGFGRGGRLGGGGSWRGGGGGFGGGGASGSW